MIIQMSPSYEKPWTDMERDIVQGSKDYKSQQPYREGM